MPNDEPAVILSGETMPERDEPLSLRVVRLVAIASDRGVTELEPLGRAIEPDALDALFSPTRLGHAENSVEASFHYAGFRVEIDTDGTVRLLEDIERRK